jgi:Predicted transcriptional regulators
MKQDQKKKAAAQPLPPLKKASADGQSEEDLIRECPDIYTFALLGGKWRLPIIWILANYGDQRDNELKRRISGITNIMLTRSLQELENHGLIARTDYQEKAPKVEYSLTPKTRDLLPALEIISSWGREFILTDKPE